MTPPRPDVAALVARAREFVAEDGSLVEASIPCPCTECESMRWIITLADALESMPAFTEEDLAELDEEILIVRNQQGRDGAGLQAIRDKMRAARLPGATT